MDLRELRLLLTTLQYITHYALLAFVRAFISEMEQGNNACDGSNFKCQRINCTKSLYTKLNLTDIKIASYSVTVGEDKAFLRFKMYVLDALSFCCNFKSILYYLGTDLLTHCSMSLRNVQV